MQTVYRLSALVALVAGLNAHAQGTAANAPGTPATPVTTGEDLDVKPAMAAATNWLARLDAGAVGDTWQESSTLMREAVTREQWEKALREVKGQLGPLVARKLVSATYTRQLPGAPPGEYVVIQYHARYENRALVTETVTPMRDKDGAWRVSGYYAK